MGRSIRLLADWGEIVPAKGDRKNGGIGAGEAQETSGKEGLIQDFLEKMFRITGTR